jgi:hypothetical protein
MIAAFSLQNSGNPPSNIYNNNKYNHSRLYGQSLDLNLHDPHPRVMVVGEHQKDKEGE